MTGDWCSTTRQSPPLHINYLSRPPNFHKRTSHICSQMTLHCRNSPQNQSLVRVLFFVNHSLDTNNRHSCAVGPDSRSQTSTWSLGILPRPIAEAALPIGLRRGNSPRLDFTSSLNDQLSLDLSTRLVFGTNPDLTLSRTQSSTLPSASCHMSNDTVAPRLCLDPILTLSPLSPAQPPARQDLVPSPRFISSDWSLGILPT